jgi:DnaK suppressor protein
MGDEVDQAQHAERLFLVTALANVGGRSNLPGRVATTCIDCGEEIDPRRLAAMDGPLRCCECQEDYERGA